MLVGRIDRGRERAAFAASLFFHALAALLFPLHLFMPGPSSEVIERISFSKISHVSVRSQRPATTAVGRRKPATKPQVIARHHAAVVHHARVASPAHRTPHAPSTATAAKSSPDQAPPVSVAAAVQQTAAPVATAAPPSVALTASPATQTVASAQGSGRRGGIAPFESTQDAYLEKTAYDELRKRFHVNVVLKVKVADDGKMLSVTFDPPVSADVEKQIKDILSTANFDPAVCGGGISCEGIATIKLTAQTPAS